MKELRLIWVVPLGIAVTGCGWVDSSGRQENRSPGLDELTQVVLEGSASTSLGVADQDRNLEKLDYVLVREGGDLSSECAAAEGPLKGVDVADFAESIEAACDPGVEQACELTLEPELLSSEVWASNIPVLRRPVARQYSLTLEDGDGASTEQTLTLCIATESSAPIATADRYDVAYDTARTIEGARFDANCLQEPGSFGVLANDTDDFDFSEDDANQQRCLVAVLETSPSNHQGAFVLNSDGGFSYSAGDLLDVGETDSFSYRASDGVNVSDVTTVEIRITGENTGPTSKNPAFTINEDEPLLLAAEDLAEDAESGPDELVLRYGVAPVPTLGSLDLLSNPPRLRYTPNPEVSGSDVFAYRVEDAGGAFVDVTVTVTINEVNDAPTIVAEQGRSVSVPIGGSDALLFTVADVEDDANGVGVTVSAMSDDLGVVTATATEELDPATPGNWRVVFNGVADGSATVTVTATDSGAVNNADPMAIAVQVGSGNQAPTVQSPSPALTTLLGEDLLVDIITDGIADDADGDNNNLEISAVTNEVGGSVSFSPGAQELTFSPSAEGTASFDLTVVDEDGASTTGSIIVEVGAATQPPVLTTETLTATSGVPITWQIEEDALASDPDTSTADLVFDGTPSASSGSAVYLTGNKSLEFTPGPAGAATISVMVRDPQGNSVQGDLNVNVSAAANLPPTVMSTTLTVIHGITKEFALGTDVTVTDPDGSAETVQVNSFTNAVEVTVAPVDGNARAFTITSDSAASGSFDLVVADEDGATGQGDMTVTVEPNQSPTAANSTLTKGNVGVVLAIDKTDLGVDDEDSAPSNVVLFSPELDVKPTGSALVSSDITVSEAGDAIEFTPDVVGGYTISLGIRDEVNSESHTFTVTVN